MIWLQHIGYLRCWLYFGGWWEKEEDLQYVEVHNMQLNLIISNKTTCSTIIVTTAFNTLNNLPSPIKQHWVFSCNI